MEAVTLSRLGLRKCLSYLEHGVKWSLEVNHLTVFLGESIHSGYRVKLKGSQSIIPQLSFVFLIFCWGVPPTGQIQQKLESMGTQEIPLLEIIEEDRAKKGIEGIWEANKYN